MLAYLRHAEGYYRQPTGEPTSEVKNIKLGLRRLKKLYGHTSAAAFDPDALTTANYRGWTVQFCQERMPKHAPTAEALGARFQEPGRDDPRLVAAESLLASWRNLLRGASCEAPPVGGEEGR
jgi:hypothetical protein